MSGENIGKSFKIKRGGRPRPSAVNTNETHSHPRRSILAYSNIIRCFSANGNTNENDYRLHLNSLGGVPVCAPNINNSQPEQHISSVQLIDQYAPIWIVIVYTGAR